MVGWLPCKAERISYATFIILKWPAVHYVVNWEQLIWTCISCQQLLNNLRLWFSFRQIQMFIHFSHFVALVDWQTCDWLQRWNHTMFAWLSIVLWLITGIRRDSVHLVNLLLVYRWLTIEIKRVVFIVWLLIAWDWLHKVRLVHLMLGCWFTGGWLQRWNCTTADELYR